MVFVADLHIHSRFSMATSRALTLPHLAAWAACKGIDVLGCGDFTHPKWREELRQGLVLDGESGLYRLKGSAEVLEFLEGRAVQKEGDRPAAGPYFCLQTEISSIYKRGGKTRKVHNLVFMPNLEAADKFSQKLALIGNIASDGRPILGLDSRDLLEIVLETSEDAYLIPAHIWTPWFSLFGSKSGFDRIEDCYGDLTGHIFALETGLSSDPDMNRRLSALDKYALISNSDAHSGPNLGREANLFEGEPTYSGMFAALGAASGGKEASAHKFLGTMEFYPEEGKYHLDGHRACGVVVDPSAPGQAPDICPVCGKPLTIGVLRRVMELADRVNPAEIFSNMETRMLVPLPEVLGEILGAGPASRKIMGRYAKILAGLGSELDVLCRLPIREITDFWEPLGEAVRRMRAGEARIKAGFDGQYGKIRLFDENELAEIRSPASASLPGTGQGAAGKPEKKVRRQMSKPVAPGRKTANQGMEYSAGQLAAINIPSPALILAGPGSGKTRVLVARIARLLAEGLPPEKILAISFTRRAAREMRERLERAREEGALVQCDTLHALAWNLLRENEKERDFALLNDEQAKRVFVEANKSLPSKTARYLWNEIAVKREKNLPLAGQALTAWRNYRKSRQSPRRAYLDYGDLLEWLLENSAFFAGRWSHILVDEAQDLSPIQLKILENLLPPDGQGFFGIGDPDQAIYGFRGASGQSGEDFKNIWPALRLCRLGESYRSCAKILAMAQTALSGRGHCGPLRAKVDFEAECRLFTAADEKVEAAWIADKIKYLLGSTAHTLLDAKKPGGELAATLSPGEIAVLVRLKCQIPPIAQALERAGLPFSAASEEEFWAEESCAALIELARSRDLKVPPEEILKLEQLANSGIEAGMLAKNPAFSRLASMWRECGSWESFFQRLAWLREAEMISAKSQNIKLLTLHASKGLEFQAVFLPGLEMGLAPLAGELVFSWPEPEEEEKREREAEERRLFYVGLTRAARAVFLSRAKKRRLYGKNLELAPSPWLEPLEKFCLKSSMKKHRRLAQKALFLFGD